jgi:hypothetical protein
MDAHEIDDDLALRAKQGKFYLPGSTVFVGA